MYNNHIFVIVRYCDYGITHLPCQSFQRYDELQSIVCQLPSNTLLHDLSRTVIDKLIRSPINSKCGIKLSLDKPLNNDVDLNILRPAVLRQYFGKEIDNINGKLQRSTYGSGTGTSSVGMDPHNFVTRSLSCEMSAMIDDIYDMLCSNKEQFNMVGVDLSKKFNHCTVLIYYTGIGLKKYTSLGYHTDCVYSPSTGEFVSKSNSQQANTPAVIYSIGDKRRLNWKCRCVGKSTEGKKVWQDKLGKKMSFELESDTLTIINPHDENPLSDKNKHDMRQYMHGGVNVSGQKFSVGFVFRVVNTTAMYQSSDDTMDFENSPGHGDVVNGVLGVNLASFGRNLSNLYLNTLY